MRPKLILWIAFSVVSSTWYILDPAAHPESAALATAPTVEIERIAQEPPRPETKVRMAQL